LHVEQAVPFFMVSNVEASSRWYIDRLGFTMKLSWHPEGKLEWCWLEIGDASLMLQEYHTPPEGKLASAYRSASSATTPWPSTAR
jgi:hypothetical protein